MMSPSKILIFQTAFLGDVVLTLPMVQVLQRVLPHAQIDFVTTPQAANILSRHPAITKIIIYDKRGKQKGIFGIFSLVRQLRAENYDIAFIPHRSLRSSLVVFLSRIAIRVGFSTSAGRRLLTHIAYYRTSHHEIERNLSLLQAIPITIEKKELPTVYPSENEVKKIDNFFSVNTIIGKPIVAFAPGSVWSTKRWLPEYFAKLAEMLVHDGVIVVLIGGKEDYELCEMIFQKANKNYIYNCAGKFSLLESAEILRRSKVVISNDSAPVHIAVAVRTPVIAIFGPTVPTFGFFPYGEKDVTIGIENLACRPCSIHGGNYCPVLTFDCMKNITPEMVYQKVLFKL